MNKFNGIAEFVATVELESFVSAAQHIGMTASGVSKAVRRLEERLGTRLLNRNTRHLSLTASGVVFYQRCRQMLLELRDAEGLVSQMLKAPTGTLRIELPPALGRLYIMPVLSNFAAQYPDFAVQAVFREQFTDLADENVDVSIRIGAVTSSRLTVQKIGSTRYITAASPEYLRRFGAPKRPEHLLQHNCLGYVSSRTGRQREWHFATARTPFSLAVTGNLAMSNTDGLIQAAINGHGVVQVMDFVALNALNSGLLKPILIDWIAREQPIMIAYPTKQGASPKVQVFTQFVSQYLPRPIALDAMRAIAS